MSNKMEFVIGFSLVFLIFIPNMGQHSLHAKSLNSDPSSPFLEDTDRTYHQWDQLMSISYKTQSISLGPILENVPALEINNSGIILKEQNNNLSIGLDKKLGKLGEGLLDNKYDALKK